jgi:hypothetical protein
VLRAALIAGLAGGIVMPTGPVLAQGVSDAQPFAGRPIDRVTVSITNPSADAAFNDRIEDSVRRALGVFPGATYSEDRLTFALGAARRNASIGDLSYDTQPTASGGVDVAVSVTLRDGAQPDQGRGFLITGNSSDFPLAFDRGGSYLKFKFDAFALYYGNNNAWYGRPDLMLAGNPLALGTPAGRGYDDWVEGYLHYGVYGITPISPTLSFYGGISAITSGSVGQELFTDETRSYTFFEDAYVGIVGGNVDDAGNRLTFNLTAGRQRFTLANGFLIANTAANGDERAALQANARWSSDLLVLGQIAYNSTKVEAFYLDPDELPVLDSKTRYAGLNVETRPLNGLMLAATYLTVPESDANYFGPTGAIVGGREGLEVYDLRFTYQPNLAGASGPFFGGEVARQTNRDFDMDARAAYAEVGYTFTDAKWSPSVSYRLAYFSGDDPATSTFERWDPMLSGGNGEQWVQGANHFKVVQDSNVIAHRLQARLKVAPKVELVPQLWVFKSDQLNNIGGNPALSVLADDDLGYEANVTVKWFKSRNTYVHGHIAYTVPGDGVKAALGNDAKNWLSAMVFVRYAF